MKTRAVHTVQDDTATDTAAADTQTPVELDHGRTCPFAADSCMERSIGDWDLGLGRTCYLMRLRTKPSAPTANIRPMIT